MESVVTFFNKYPEISYKKGEIIVHRNEYVEQVYFVKQGFVRFFRNLESGQEITINHTNTKKRKHALFGITYLMEQYQVEAFTDVIVHRAPRNIFYQFLDENPHLYKYLVEDLKIYYEQAIKQIEWLSIPDSYSRISALLYILADKIGKSVERSGYDTNEADPIHLEYKTTHQLIASLTGLTRETVTLQLNKLLTEEVISRANGVLVINNLDKLHNKII